MIRKYASLEGAQILELRSSPTRRVASLDKLSDFQEYKTADGFLYARIRAISSRVNRNHDGWPSIELAGGQDIFDHHISSVDGEARAFVIAADRSRDHGFSTFLGKPIFVDHHNSDPSRARGVIVDARFHVEDHKTASLDPYYASKEVDSEHLPGSWIELLLEVDAKQFPKFAKAVVEGSRNPRKGIDGWSMGADVSHTKCSVCSNIAREPAEYCKHVKLKGAHFDHIDTTTGKRTSKKAYENCYGVKFFEISGVFDPADETALSLEHARTAKTAEYQLPHSPEDWHHFNPEEEVPDNWGAIPCPQCHQKAFSNLLGRCDHCGFKVRGELGDSLGLSEADPKGVGTLNHGEWNPEEFPARWGKSQEATITQHPKEKGLKDLADEQAEDYLENTERGIKRRRDKTAELHDLTEIAQLRRQVADPAMQHQIDKMLIEQGDRQVLAFLKQLIYGAPAAVTASLKTAENPPPQADMSHAPEKVDTLRNEEVCPVCGSSMDEDTCSVCGHQEPPKGFDNPDLTKAHEADGPTAPPDDPTLDAPRVDPNEGAIPSAPDAAPPPVNTPSNPALASHVTSDMEWDVHSRTAARINKTERPLSSSTKPQSNEPLEKILSDQIRPVTSRVRTAAEFIAATTSATRRHTMNHTADAASGAPADAKPDVKTDVIGVGGVDQASNDAASKADKQVDVLGIGGTGVESVAAEKEGVNVEQGDEHSKNIESIPTKTWSGEGPGNGDSLGQQEPVTSETPSWVDESKWSRWQVEAHDDAPFPDDEISGGGAVKGNQPIAESFGERVDVLDHLTSPANNSGPTKTWSGTDGNGVNKQQDPVTNDSIARGESGLEGAPNWTSSTHIFSAFKLADLEVAMGLIGADQRYPRAAELERETPLALDTALKYAQRIRQAARRTAATQKLPVMGRATEYHESAEKTASAQSSGSEDDSFMFGGF